MIAETNRLILRELEPSDAAAIHGVFSEPEATRFSLRVHSNLQQTVEWIEAVRKGYAKLGFGPWAVVLKSDGSVIGYSGCSLIRIDGVEEREVGYRILPSHQRRGFATEATAAARDYAFGQLGFARLVAAIQPANVASVRVAEKMGMILERNTTFHGVAVALYVIEQPSEQQY